jgi:hypothetical protein
MGCNPTLKIQTASGCKKAGRNSGIPAMVVTGALLIKPARFLNGHSNFFTQLWGGISMLPGDKT